MIEQTYTLGGDECRILTPERPSDLGAFEEFLARDDTVLGFDTETTDLDIFKADHRLRMLQFGNRDLAFNLRADLFGGIAREALLQPRMFTAHNAPFDWLVVDRHLGVKVEEFGPRCFDTRVMAHLLDPRSEHEGGTGLSLKPLSAVYVDDSAPDTSEGLKDVFLALWRAWQKTVSAEDIAAFKRRHPTRPHIPFGFANVDIYHPLYTLYSGLDPLLARRLFDALGPLVKGAGVSHLSKFEHHLAVLLAIMQRRGIRVDEDYTRRLRDRLHAEAEHYRGVAKRFGVENVNSTGQVSAALVAMGETLTERTKTGLKVDKEVLMPLADLDRDWNRIEARSPNLLADAVLRSKRSEKWATAYADAFLDLMDPDGRLHPFIGGLQARTARMSISRPPLQQLPSSDWTIRRALTADPGHLIISSDYDQIEMRVLAALAPEPAMIRAIKDGLDLHDFTASMLYGPNFTKRQRKMGKGVGFGKVYGGGATTLSRQTGAPLPEVKEAIAAYDRSFPGIKRYGRRLQTRAQFGAREVVTETGRHLPLDRDRLYAATNYAVQSLSRDILAQAIVSLFDKGLGDHLLLPVHDELVAQAPAKDAEEVARIIGETMTRAFKGVPISSTGEVAGPSWGSAYGCPPEEDIPLAA
jgi:DNA polymerase-1